MPSASDPAAMMVNPGFFARLRIPKRMSAKTCSIHSKGVMASTFAFRIAYRLPTARSAQVQSADYWFGFIFEDQAEAFIQMPVPIDVGGGDQRDAQQVKEHDRKRTS